MTKPIYSEEIYEFKEEKYKQLLGLPEEGTVLRVEVDENPEMNVIRINVSQGNKHQRPKTKGGYT